MTKTIGPMGGATWKECIGLIFTRCLLRHSSMLGPMAGTSGTIASPNSNKHWCYVQYRMKLYLSGWYIMVYVICINLLQTAYLHVASYIVYLTSTYYVNISIIVGVMKTL